AVSDYVKTHTAVCDTVWADQAPRLLLETGRAPGCRLPHDYFFMNYDDAPLEYAQVMLNDFVARCPKYLIFQDLDGRLRDQLDFDAYRYYPKRRANFQIAWERIQRYVSANYHCETVIEGYAIYRRR